jgi:AcrR family transcriptional regulator
MQILKEEIKLNILRRAEELFYKNGYERTSMRVLSSEVGISTSNIYKYFANKETLFEAVVGSYYKLYVSNLAYFINQGHVDTVENDSLELKSLSLLDSIKQDRKKFIILMEGARNTKYEAFRNEIQQMFEQHIRAFLGKKQVNDFMVRVFTNNFWQGVLEIAKNYENDEWALLQLKLLTKYHMNGINSI